MAKRWVWFIVALSGWQSPVLNSAWGNLPCSDSVIPGSEVFRDSFESPPQRIVSAGSFVGPWGVESGTVEVLVSGVFTGPHSGFHFLDLNGGDSGKIFTPLTTVPGHDYCLSFAYTRNPNSGTPTTADIRIEGTTILSISAPITNPGQWNTTSVVFTAASTRSLLFVASTSPGMSGTFLDSFTVTDLSYRPTNIIVYINDKVLAGTSISVEGSAEVRLEAYVPNPKISYTLDGSDPAGDNSIAYNGPFTVQESSDLRALAFSTSGPERQETGPIAITVYPVFPYVMLNSGFEDPPSRVVFSGAFVEGWKVLNGNIEVITSIGAISPHSGLYFIDLNGTSAGTISTNLFTVPTLPYVLNVAYSRNPNGPDPVTADVRVDGRTVMYLARPTAVLEQWATTSVVFTATSLTSVVSVVSTTTGGSGLLLDSIVVRGYMPPTNLLVVVNGEFVLEDHFTSRGSATIVLVTTLLQPTIFYTLDGTDPAFAGYLYDGPISVTESRTVRVIAYDATFQQYQTGGPITIDILPTLQWQTRGGGSVNVDPPEGDYLSGNGADVIAVADQGWQFLHWLGDASGQASTERVLVFRDSCVEAVFGTQVSTSKIGQGSIQISPQFLHVPFGEQMRLTAVPAAGQRFVIWSGLVSSTNNPLAHTLTTPTPNFIAVFAALNAGETALSVLERGGGTVTVSPRANCYAVGRQVILTAMPEQGQEFLGWSGDASGQINPLTLTMTQSRRIEANFTTRSHLQFADCPGPFPGGTFRGIILGEPGSLHQVQVSSNVVDWQDLVSVTNVSGRAQFTDVGVTNANRRFFRVRTP